MGKLIDLTNQCFGKLTVIERDFNYPIRHNSSLSRGAFWKCLCDCGNYTTICGQNLRNNKTNSCGKCVIRKNNLLGKQFGKLTVIGEAPRTNKDTHAFWYCKCKCGNVIVATSDQLISKNRNSCRCNKSKGEETITKLLQENNIKFEKEKIFKDCINPETNWLLRYDFYLLEYNRLIEFDGQQHYQAVKYWGGGEEGLQERQKKDLIKTDYAKKIIFH